VSDGEEALVTQARWLGWPPPTREFRFDPKRQWRFDLAWPERRLAVEVEGGQWRGGHGGSRFELDIEKYNAAALANWTVIRVTPRMVEDGRAADVIARALDTAPILGPIPCASCERLVEFTWSTGYWHDPGANVQHRCPA